MAHPGLVTGRVPGRGSWAQSKDRLQVVRDRMREVNGSAGQRAPPPRPRAARSP